MAEAGLPLRLLFWTAAVTSVLTLSDPEVREHYLRVQKFRCSVPRLSVVTLTELQAPGVSSKHFLPEMTVLHRCDVSAGCCGPGLVCGPAETETVTLPFLVTYMVDVVDHPKNTSVVERITAVNHTRCECLPWGQPPR